MSSSKSLRLALPRAVPVGVALLASALAAHAAAPSFSAAIAPAAAVATSSPHSVAVPAVPAPPVATATTDAQATRQANASAASAVVSSSMPTTTGETHLTLRDIDDLARSKLTRTLRGDGDAAASSAAVTLKTPAPVENAPAVVVRPYVPPARTSAVSFVGAYADGSGQHVLYEYNGAVYPARVGEKLLNGWIARRVDGLSVTVAEGKRTWSVPMSSNAPASSNSTLITGSALGDLSSPLPPGVSMAQPVSSFGRQ
ncbi:hypothetical protein LMG28688_06118 [Paraburkholderia caffeinitolerans]|uniref:Type IV pilus biogenesis protein PilP n=1 Tax=Paraburkholderia caffeinitolerans TaxID=1723730 RepID=A0A6J5GQI3_9BURK|nr:hypothetical protein [Paraburkholderia caffeinitolerans]CAB3805120.1 hypothetical protein LMG28688_06118 [Paraburkholderia caffeinitolerans]